MDTRDDYIQRRFKTLKLLKDKAINVGFISSFKEIKSDPGFQVSNHEDTRSANNVGLSNKSFEETINDSGFQVSNDEETWLYVPEGCDASNTHERVQSSNYPSLGSIWSWLELSNVASISSSNVTLVSATQKDASFSLPETGYRKNVVDSRTYTRPKKLSGPAALRRCLENVSNENVCTDNSPLTSTTSNRPTSVETATSNDNNSANHSASYYNTASSRNNKDCSILSEFNGDVTDAFSTSFKNNTLLTNTACFNTTFQNRTADSTQSLSHSIIDIDNMTDSLLGFNNSVPLMSSSEWSQQRSQLEERKNLTPFACENNRQPNMKYKLDETFLKPSHYSLNSKTEVVPKATNSSDYSVISSAITSINGMNVNDPTNDPSKSSNTTNQFENYSSPPLSSRVEETNEYNKQLSTPPSQPLQPVAVSTPNNRMNELKRKITYDAISVTSKIQVNGISDSLSDIDVSSISSKDLTEDPANSGINNFNLDSSQKENLGLNETYDVLEQESFLNSTQNLTMNKSRNSPMMNSPSPKAMFNTTFSKSTEALNPPLVPSTERADSGPEDDCMSTASDCSSSSNHMRSVGEIQSIARLQEESLRPQTRKKLAYCGSDRNNGLLEMPADLRSSVTKLSSDNQNQLNQTVTSLNRCCPNMLNNNYKGDAKSGVYEKKVTGSSTGLSLIGSGYQDQTRTFRMTGIRAPSLLSRPTGQPRPLIRPASSATYTSNSSSLLGRPSTQPRPQIRATSSATVTSNQIPLPVQPSGLQAPRSVSRLPSPKFRSGLPKFCGPRH